MEEKATGKKGVIFLPWSRYRGIEAAHPEYTVRNTTPIFQEQQDRVTYHFFVQGKALSGGRRTVIAQDDGWLSVALYSYIIVMALVLARVCAVIGCNDLMKSGARRFLSWC